MHPLLQRQLKHWPAGLDPDAAGLQKFLDLIDQTYLQADTDRALVEHSLEMASHELYGRNRELQDRIHERNLVEESLREAERKYRSIFENAVLGIFQTTLEGQYLAVNPALAEMYGYSSPDDLKESLKDIERQLYVRDGRREEFIRQISEIGAVINFVSEVYRKDGSVIWICERAHGVRDEMGKLLYFEGTVEDVTDRHATEAALVAAKEAAEKASRAKSQFLANMSHEIRTPLNGVVGFVDLLLDTELTAQQRRHAELIKSSGTTLGNLINDILDLSKIEAGKLELEVVDFDLRLVVEDVTEMLSPKAAAKGLEVACHVPDDVPHLVRGDGDRLRQILINLVNNAIKFTDAGEVVSRAHLEESTETHVLVKFSVTDAGVGIPRDRLDRLFKSFSQVDASTTRKYGGTGLGLAICKQLAELMGGTIGVETEAGKGSTFWFTARLEKSHQKNLTRMAMPVNPGDVRVLAVDDHSASREILQQQVSSWGLKAATAANGQQAMQLLIEAAAAGTPFKVAIIDRDMPGEDGAQIAKAIKAHPELQETVLMALLSMDSQVDASQLRQMGFAGYMTKPVRQSCLFDAIMNAIGASGGASPQTRAPMPTAPETRSPARRAARILLAEDNQVNQILAAAILTRAGYRFDIVSDGQQAVSSWAAKRYDLILMDCQMPVMDGLEATRAIRLAEQDSSGNPSRRIPIIALTANAVKGDREQCLEAGMDGYASKPIDPRHLIHTIDSLLPPESFAAMEGPQSSPAVEAPPLDVAGLMDNCMKSVATASLILDKFAQQIAQDMVSLTAFIGANDGEKAARVAHGLKGAAGVVAARPIRDIAADLERIGRGNDMADADQRLQSLKREVDRCADFIPKAKEQIQAGNKK